MPEPISQPAPPELHLDPDGRPLVVFDLQGDPRDLTVWGAIVTDGAVALVATDTEDPPTGEQSLELAAELCPQMAERIAELTAELDSMRGKRDRAREHAVRNERERDAAVAELDRQAARLIETFEQLDQARTKAQQWEDAAQWSNAQHVLARQQLDDTRAQLAVLQEHVDGLSAERDAARASGRDVARLAVLALGRTPKSTRRLRGIIRRDLP